MEPSKPEHVWTRLDYLALGLATTALVLFFVVGLQLAGFAMLIAAVMSWTRVFDENKAKGKPTIGNKARMIIGAVAGGLALLLMFTSGEDVEPSAPVPAVSAPVQKPSFSPADAIAMEKRNETKIREFIADEKTLPKRNYESRVDFWKEITAMAPANVEYSKKLAEAERNLAEVGYAKQNPEQGMQVEKVDGRKAGFGNVLMIDITLRNDSLSNLKDFQISCESKGPSGSVLGVNEIVLYEMVNARETRTFRKVNMGLLNQQAQSTNCQVIQSSIG